MAGNIGIYNPNQRKMLGKRFGTDPALLLAQQELENKYARVPGQEQLTLEREKMTQAIDAQNQQAKQAGISGLIGTAGNLATTGMMANAYKGNDLFYPLFGKATPPVPAKTGFGVSTVADTNIGTVNQLGGKYPFLSEAGGPIRGLLGEPGLPTTSTWAMPKAWSSAFDVGPMAYSAGAGYLGGMLGQPIGEAIGVGGQKERGAVGGALAGAAAGAAATSWSGPGAAVGAVIGGVVGLVTGGKGTWICTATNKHVGTSKEQKASMKKLRRYAKENFPCWLEFYNINGPSLILEIEEQEPDLVLFYNIVKRKLVEPCVLLIDKGDLKGAFDLYKKNTEELFKEYAPDIIVQEVL